MPRTTPDPSTLDKTRAGNSSVADLQQDQHSVQAAQHDIRQDEDRDDDEGEDENREEIEGQNNEVNAEKLNLAQNLSISASTQDTVKHQQGLSVGQKDDGHVIRQNLQDVQTTQPVLPQNRPSDPRMEKILQDLRSLLADLGKA
ncbi:MAG: hypothetical protein HY205_06510 [Nitrospirae bacterium]|nr:hypothetical protein [Nitrospirota bacterium]